MLYVIYWGIAGGYGGISDSALIEADSLEDAEKDAYWRSREQIEDEGLDEDENGDYNEEEIDTWLDYEAEIYTGSKEQIKRMTNYNFVNETMKIKEHTITLYEVEGDYFLTKEMAVVWNIYQGLDTRSSKDYLNSISNLTTEELLLLKDFDNIKETEQQERLILKNIEDL